MNIKGLFLASVLALSHGVAGGAEAAVIPPPQQWLDKMATSARELTYQGEFVYQQGSSLETLSVVHYVDENGKEKERILYLDGAPREMIRTDRELTFSNYRQGVTRFEHGAMVPMVDKFSQQSLGKNYELKIVGLDRVAGREALLMMVVPRDRFRYGYQIWLDRTSSLLLKSMMIDDNGRIMERMQFTSMKVDEPLAKEILAELDKKQPEADRVISMDEGPAKKALPDNWEAGWIPDGFVLKDRRVRPSPVSKQDVDALIFSDGIASFSVFVEKDETRVLSQTAENIGALAAVSKVYRDGDSYYHVTVVGEVPLGTAERVAVSVRPVKSDS